MKLAKTAIRLYRNPLVPKHIQRHNQRAWLRSIQFLGDRWLLARKVERIG